MNKNNTDYLYYRQLYSNQYYSKKGYIEVILPNKKTKYLYFDKDKHMKLTDNKKFASKFYRKPKNYDKYEAYIKKIYKDSVIIYNEEVIVKNKY